MAKRMRYVTVMCCVVATGGGVKGKLIVPYPMRSAGGVLIPSLGHSCSGVLGGIRGYTAYTNLRGFFDSVYSPQ